MASEKTSSKRRAWLCTYGLPTDVTIEVDGLTFHLHKFPLMSKSGKLRQLIEEQEKSPTRKTAGPQANDSEEEEEIQVEEKQEEDKEQCHLVLPGFPGGSDSFETAIKFCYGMKINLSSANVAPVRCAGEYLEMREDYWEGNLISETEMFISQSVLTSVPRSIITLNSCQGLLPMAENLGIVHRCINAIASKIAASDPSLFGLPVNDEAAKYKGADETSSRKNLSSRKTLSQVARAAHSLLDEPVVLSLPFFKRLIFATKGLNVSAEIIQICLIHYAKKYIPGTSRTIRKPYTNVLAENEQREILETIICNLPKEKISQSPARATRFLFGLLRTAYILDTSEACRSTLERKIGLQLEHATLDDLLIPSYSYSSETLYDVDCVERILRYFLEGMEERSAAAIEEENRNVSARAAALMRVGKLIDGYLSEIASDANLSPKKFSDLAVALPDEARLLDDGLYRAADIYIKAHPRLPEADKEKITGVLNFQKLTLEARILATQNERLPLRAVVQLLFSEQLQLRRAIARPLPSADAGRAVAGGRLSHGGAEVQEYEVAGASTPAGSRGAEVREYEVLRQDMDNLKTRVQELEKECTNVKKAIQQIGQPGHVEKGGCLARFRGAIHLSRRYGTR